LQGEGKKLRLFHRLHNENGDVAATGNQLLIHVNLETRRSCLPGEALLSNLVPLAQAHSKLPSIDS